MATVVLPNPLWTGQLYIQGGPRRLALTAAGYLALLIGVTVTFRSSGGAGTALPVFALWALNALTAVQIVLIALGGIRAVFRAVRRDVTTRMIESLRIAPMGTPTVVIGYLFGATLPVTMLFAIGVLYGVGLAVIAGHDVQRWLLGNAVVFVTAVAIWAPTLFFSLTSAKRPLAPGLFIAGISTLWGWGPLLPAVAVLCGVLPFIWSATLMLASPTLFGAATRFDTLGFTVVIVLAMGVFWAMAAGRRFRHPHLPALSPFAAFVLQAIWTVVSAVATAAAASGWIALPGDRVDAEVRIIAFWVSLVAIAPLPFCMAVQSRALAIGRSPRLPFGERCTPYGWALASAALMTAIVPLWRQIAGPGVSGSESGLLLTGLGMLAALWLASAVLELSYLTTQRFLVGAVILLALWVLPPLIEYLRVEVLRQEGRPAAIGGLYGTSAVGTLLAVWLYNRQVPIGPGLAVQAGLALIGSLLSWRTYRQSVRRIEARRAEGLAHRPALSPTADRRT